MIHKSWLKVLRGMRRTYAGQGRRKCYDVQGGSKFCASAKAWSVFFAMGNKRYGSGFETKPMKGGK